MSRASVFFKGEAFLDLWISCVHVFLHLGELRAREASGFPPTPYRLRAWKDFCFYIFSRRDWGGVHILIGGSDPNGKLSEGRESALDDRGGLGPGLGLLQSEALGTEGSYIPQGSLGIQGWTQA